MGIKGEEYWYAVHTAVQSTRLDAEVGRSRSAEKGEKGISIKYRV